MKSQFLSDDIRSNGLDIINMNSLSRIAFHRVGGDGRIAFDFDFLRVAKKVNHNSVHSNLPKSLAYRSYGNDRMATNSRIVQNTFVINASSQKVLKKDVQRSCHRRVPVRIYIDVYN